MTLVLLGSLLVAVPVTSYRGSTSSSSDTPASQPSCNSYEFRSYALNMTSRTASQDGTKFCFEEAGLPMPISDLAFGDFREDQSFCSSYYGGSGILVNASGEDSTIVLGEANGRVIACVEYHGQSLLVFGGETRSTSSPETVAHNGTDILVQDWRCGNWSPSLGVFFEHNLDVYLADASMYIMVFVPVYEPMVPEFSVAVPVILVLALVMIVFRRAREPGPG